MILQKTRKYIAFFYQRLPVALLLLIPISLICLGFQLRSAGGPFSLAATDPEFIFLFSGVALTMGRLDLFIDQPGTPLQVMEGITARIIHFFRPGQDFVTDVMQHPDLYLHIISVCILLLVAAGVFLAGYIVYRRTGNLPAALFLQFTPFVAEQVFSTLERVMIEPLFIPFFSLFFAYLWLDSLDKLPSQGFFNRRVLVYAIITGLGLSLKFNFIPFLVLPLFMLRSWKEKGSFALLTAGFFYLFTFPLFVKTRTFYRWIKALILHSGVYGTGKNNVLDVNQFLSHLSTMMHNQKFLFATILAGSLLLMASYLPPLRQRLKGSSLPSLLAGMLVAEMLGIFLVAKHYSERYLIPELLLVVPLLFICIQVLIHLLPERFRRAEYLLYALIVFLIAFHPQTFRQHRMYLPLKRKTYEAKLESIRFLRQLPAPDALLLSSDNWSIRPEYGLFFGMVMTPGGTNLFGSTLNTLYPSCYLFKEYTGSFFDWYDKPHPAQEIIEKYPATLLVTNRYTKEDFARLESVFRTLLDAEMQLLYENELVNLRIYLIRRK
ncbi:MAG: hypothetical protein ACPLXM_07155 [Bacteroidales bacterium]